MRQSMRRLGAVLMVVTLLWVPPTGQTQQRPAPEAERPIEVPSALEQARRLGQPVELEPLTTETTKVFADPSGAFRAQVHARPVRARSGDGWVPIDTTLVVSGDGRVRPKAAAVEMSFSGGGDDRLAWIARDGKAMWLTWPGRLPKPRLSGQSVTYPEVLAGVDLVVHAAASGFSEVLVVKDARAAAQPQLSTIRFGVRTEGLRSEHGDDGTLSWLDGRGEVMVASARPWMWDSAGGSAEGAAQRLRSPARGDRRSPMGVSQDADGLVIVPDARMLTAADVKFPLYLDPSFSAGRLHWTMVSADLPSQSWWDAGYHARIGRDPEESTTDRFRSYFELDTSLFSGRHIIRATFSARSVWARTCTPEAVNLWHSGTINSATNWNSRPALLARIGQPVMTAKGGGTACPAGDVEFDATPLMTQLAAAATPKVTVALASNEDSGANGAKAFENNPAIVVEFNSIPSAPLPVATDTMPGCEGAPGMWVTTTRPWLKVSVEDFDDRWGDQHRVSFEIRDQSGLVVHAPPETDWTVLEHEVPEGVLADGGRYEWRARARDAVDTGAWSPWCPFAVDTAGPTTQPRLSSTGFPPFPRVGLRVDQTGEFLLDAAGDTDIVRFEYRISAPSFTSGEIAADVPGGTARLAFTPPAAGLHTITVSGVDRAGNHGVAITPYRFRVAALPEPIVHVTMDDGQGGVAADGQSGAGTTTLAGGYSWIEGRHGGGLGFDGVSSTYGRTAAPVVNTAASFSVMAWARLDNDQEYRMVLTQAATVRNAFEVGFEKGSGRWIFGMRQSDADDGPYIAARSDTQAQVGLWTHLAGVYDHAAGQMRLYVNGRLAGTAAHTSTWSGSGVMQLGHANWVGFVVDPWLGGLDDVQVYDFATSQRKVAEEMHTTDTLGPQGWWRFEDGAGVAAQDVSGSGHHLARTGDTAWSAGRSGGGLDLSGGSAHASGPVIDPGNSYTVAAWVKLEHGDEWAAAVTQDGRYDRRFTLGFSKISPRGWVFGATNLDTECCVSDPPMPLALADTAAQFNVWTHLAGVYDHAAGQLRIYVNGRLAGTAAHRSTVGAVGGLAVGRSQNNGWHVDKWPGSLDEVRVAGTALSAEELKEWMNWDHFGLGAHWKFDEGSGELAADSSDNDHVAGLTPGATWTQGRHGQALHLGDKPDPTAWEGASAYTAGPVVRTDASFTVAAWVRLDRPETWRNIVSQDGPVNSGFSLYYDALRQSWGLAMPAASGTQTTGVYSLAIPQAQVWTHVAGVYDHNAGQLSIYVNGRLSGTAAHRSTWNAGGAVQIGRSKLNGLWIDYWLGDIDDVRLEARVWTAEDLKRYMAGDAYGPNAGWNLDEGTGTLAADATGNGHTVTTGTGVTWTPGKRGSALRFNGTGSAGTGSPVVDTRNSFTVTAWVRLSRDDKWYSAVSQDGAHCSGFDLRYDALNRRWAFAMYGSDAQRPTEYSAGSGAPWSYSINVWTHLAGVYDSSTKQLRLYVNGSLTESRSFTSTWNATGSLRIGRAKVAGLWTQHWSGDIDEVRLFDTAKTQTQIQQIMNGTA